VRLPRLIEPRSAPGICAHYSTRSATHPLEELIQRRHDECSTAIDPRAHTLAMSENLFVYGSLKPGHQNAHLLEAIGGTWLAASVVGSLQDTGWGAGIGYPALTLDANGGEVHGFVFSSERLTEHWHELDDFEGAEYARVMTTVTLDDGRLLEAHVYVARPGAS